MINLKDREFGLGREMYRAALRYSDKNFKGIGGENEQRYNKNQIPKIYKSLGGRQTENGDWIIDRKN